MKMRFILLMCTATLFSVPCSAKRPKKEKPKHSHSHKTDGTEDAQEPHVYQPNPIILAGVGQIMNGALSIAQDPHSRPNLGHSIAHMIHGIMTIIIEKITHKNITVDDQEDMKEYLNELCAAISQEITEIIVSKQLSIHDNYDRQ